MIYKFIDDNGSEITVNSLSSVKSLIENQTINENTKIKAGLRGKWLIAKDHDELKNFFEKKQAIADDNINDTKESIRDYISKENFNDQNPDNDEEVKIIQKRSNIIIEEDIKPSTTKSKETNSNVTKKSIEDINQNINVEIKNEEEPTTFDENEGLSDSKDDEHQGLSFIESIKTCYKKYFDFSSRASRSEYWFFWLFNWVFYILGTVIAINTSEAFFWILGIFYFATLIPFLSVTARRLHDIGKTGWMQLLPIPFSLFSRVPDIGIIFSIISGVCYLYIFILLVSIGEQGKNKFGDYPLKKK